MTDIAEVRQCLMYLYTCVVCIKSPHDSMLYVLDHLRKMKNHRSPLPFLCKETNKKKFHYASSAKKQKVSLWLH